MEISILLITLLIILSLGGVFLFGCDICLIKENQIDALLSINYELKDAPFQWAVKLVSRIFYMLNDVTVVIAQKTTQTTLNQPQNLKFEG
ncbi:hypothetical protein [Falsiporphyromonas endometrii]|uniref:Uncharacterized protein n=1 Tax=Falsiporphyromonas endometrii TaxID=1387297 RepID=A0ABV9K6G3_9PORP